MKCFFVLICIVFWGVVGVNAQTGPGGVGMTNGSSNLKVWLRADDLNGDNIFSNNPSNGTLVDFWNDFSGWGNHYSNTGANRPTYSSSGTYKSVKFDASLTNAQYLKIVTSGGSYSSSSAFFALNPVNNGNSNSLFDNASFSLRVEQFSNTNKVGYTRYGVSDYSSSLVSPFGTNSIVSYHKQSSSSSFSIMTNASTANIDVASSAAGIPYDRIGGTGSGSDEASGDFFEVILFNTQINCTEVILVNNYLSAKYGNISIPNDLYDEDNTSSGNFDFDVAGIGRTNISDMHTDSRGSGIVRINNPTDLSDNEFFIWGHNNGALQASEKADVPPGVEARLLRLWRVSEVNLSSTPVDVGAIDITWDLTGLGTVSASDLRLLVDTDNDGLFSDEVPISGAVSVGASQYRFSGVTAIGNNMRFTLATINKEQTPLPIELLDFRAKRVNGGSVLLEWLTASELNNDYFTLERSADMEDWDEIATIDGSGNLSIEKKYEYQDENPLISKEVFYRLKQTDFDGEFTYSGVISINTSTEKTSVNIYPNPSAGMVDIEGDENELVKLEVFTSSGQNISGNVEKIVMGETHIQLDLSNFPDGLYYIKTSTKTFKIILKKI